MKFLFLSMIVLMYAGCGRAPSDTSPVVAKVGNYVISQDEFNDAFKASSYGQEDSPASRKAFLDNMINQKLIMLNAQSQGLDKDKDFLKMIENFWQQSLVTVALQSKVKEGVNLDQWIESIKNSTKIEISEEYLK